VDFQVSIGEQTLLAAGHPSLRTPVGESIYLSIDTEKCVALAGDK
jgi:iron(III) transport system ATP-binding protein